MSGQIAFAQNRKMGDNLGNHRATQSLNMNGKDVYNINGVAIGVASVTNNAVALQVGAATAGTKAMLIPRVDDLLNATSPSIPNALAIDGMMVFNNANKYFYVRQNGAWVSFGTMSLATGNIYIGDNTNTAVARIMSGDATLDATGKLTIANDAITTAKILNANVTPQKIALTDGNVLIGNSSNAAAAVAVTGDVTFTNAGVSTIAAATKTNNRVLTTNASGVTTWVDKAAYSGMAKTPVVLSSNPWASVTTANTAVTVNLTLRGLNEDDGVVVNIKASDAANFDYIMILSAYASNGAVVLKLADMRPLPDDGVYVPPSFSTLNFIVTTYHVQ